MIVAWKKTAVIAEYPCKWGRGAMLLDEKEITYPVPAGMLPKDFRVGDRFLVFVSGGGNGQVVEARPIGREELHSLSVCPDLRNHSEHIERP